MNPIDSSLWVAFKKGDHDAFQEVYQRYYQLLYVIILSIVHHAQTAEDLLQEAFLKIYQKRHTIKKIESFQAWMMTIAKRMALNELKKPKPTFWDNEWNQVGTLDQTKSLFQTWHQHLSLIENQVVAYKIVFELGFQDIADLLDLSLAQTHEVYTRAMDKLRLMYQGNQHEK